MNKNRLGLTPLIVVALTALPLYAAPAAPSGQVVAASPFTMMQDFFMRPELGMFMLMRLPAETLFEAQQNYFHLKQQPRYKRLVASITEEFLAYPELRSANARYYKDNDPHLRVIRFAKDVAASPNFWNIVRKYGGSSDFKQFVWDMTKTPRVQVAFDDVQRGS